MRFLPLTDIHPLVAVVPGKSVSAAAAVEAAKVAVALAGAVEVADGPPLPIVPAVVRVLGAVRARVHCNVDALSASRAGATRVVDETFGRRAALSASEPLGRHAHPGELSAHDCRGRQEQKAPQDHDLHASWRENWRKGVGCCCWSYGPARG